LNRVIDAAGFPKDASSRMPWPESQSALKRPALLKEQRRRDCARRHLRPYIEGARSEVNAFGPVSSGRHLP
jgi:hypothetical protein